MLVLDRVKSIVAEHHGISPDSLTPETRFAQDLGESLDTVEVIMECEAAFQISIPDEDAAQLVTLGLLTAYIEAKLDPHRVWLPSPQRSV